MTRDEILALSDDELRIKAAELLGFKPQEQTTDILNRFPLFDMNAGTCLVGGKFMGIVVGGETHAVPDYPNDIAAAMVLFNKIYDSRSKLYGGAWVLGTVDGGQDCSLATLFFKKKLLSRHRPEKIQVKTKKKQMAKAITLAYVLAMEGAIVEPECQPEERK